MRSYLLAVVSCILLVATGCNQADYIELKPDTLTLRQPNDSIWMQARAMSHTGVHYSRVPIAWSVKDPEIAKVDETGKLFPLKSGRTEVTARTGKIEASAPVEVLFAEKLELEPKALALQEGGSSVELTVKVYDYLGRELKDRMATFKSLDKEVVSMGQNAAFPVNAGKAQVEVQVENLVQKVDVTVTPEKGDTTAKN